MATIRRRGRTWQVRVRRHGLRPLARTFRTKADADLWARQRAAEIDRGDLPVDHRILRSLTLGALLERYRDQITPQKRGADRERYKLRVLLAHPMVALSLDRLTPAVIAGYRDHRPGMVKADTVRRELAIVQHCLGLARDEWGVPLPTNPVRRVNLPHGYRASSRHSLTGPTLPLSRTARA